jgi:hypothetical protein
MPSTRFVKPAVGVILTIGAFGFVGAVTASAAHADTADEQYLGALQQQGISFGTPQGAIGIAHHVCDALDGGMEPREISDHIAAANSRIAPHTALVIVVDAATSYCPQFVHQMANGATVVGPNH